MGWSSEVIVARQVIVQGSHDGIFVYSPTPGLGNLAGSWATQAGTDRFGNVYRAGLTGYAIAPYPAAGNLTLVNAAGAVVFLIDNALAAWFMYQDLGSATQGALMASFASKPGTDPVTGTSYPAGMQGIDPAFGDFIQVTGANINLGLVPYTKNGHLSVGPGSGAANPFIEIDAPEQGQAGHNVIRLEGTSPDGSNLGGEEHWLDNGSGNVQSGFYAFCGDIDYLLPGTAVPGTVEAWHPMTFANAWANAGGSNVTGKYRRVAGPARNVEVIGRLTHAAISGASTFTNLPAGYRPASAQSFAGIDVTNTAACEIYSDSSGVVKEVTAAATTEISFHGFFSLDS